MRPESGGPSNEELANPRSVGRRLAHSTSFRRVTPGDLWFATGPSKASCPGAWRNAGSPRDLASTPRSADTPSGSRKP